MKKNKLLLLLFIFLYNSFCYSQENPKIIEKKRIDSLYIEETERNTQSAKVLHAEPLYIDLIRDLGARKGEKEWNLGGGISDKINHDEYAGFIEYEWAHIYGGDGSRTFSDALTEFIALILENEPILQRLKEWEAKWDDAVKQIQMQADTSQFVDAGFIRAHLTKAQMKEIIAQIPDEDFFLLYRNEK